MEPNGFGFFTAHIGELIDHMVMGAMERYQHRAAHNQSHGFDDDPDDQAEAPGVTFLLINVREAEALVRWVADHMEEDNESAYPPEFCALLCEVAKICNEGSVIRKVGEHGDPNNN